MAACPSCGVENPADKRFCGDCGTKLEVTPVREERKVITALFCDLVGSTALGERLDAEDISHLLREYQTICRARIESHGGVVEKFIGDAVVGVFGVPLAHEDDPERAVRVALRITDDIRASDLGIEVRIGVNTGETLVRLDIDPRSGEGFATGDTMNTAARLEAAAPVMGVAVGVETYRASAEAIAYKELPAISAKGKSKPVQAWRALNPIPRVGTEERDRTPFVGRDLELSMLTQLFDRSRSRPATEFVTIIAEPGLGKSRLVRELARHVDRFPEPVTWRVGRCLPYGDGITFWALGEIVKAQAGILETDDQATLSGKLDLVLAESDEQTRTWIKDRLAPLVGLETSTEPPKQEEAFTAWRRFLEKVAATNPTVLVIEDLHWADEAFVAFLEHLTERTAGLPLLVVVTARPEVEEHHPSWPPGRRSTVLSLSPLTDEDLETLTKQGFPEANPELISIVLERAGGSPLFAEQLAAMLRERTLPIADGALDETMIPSSVQALIAARIDALPPEPKRVLMEASVVGKTFWAGAVSAFGEHLDLDTTLGELVRREFCRPVHPSTMEGDAEFGFWHALVRDVAYAELTRAQRADMHELAADWFEIGAGGSLHEHQEFVAYHLQTALECLTKGKLTDDRAIALTSRTASALASAGSRSFARGDMVGARRFLSGAVTLWPPDEPRRLELVPELADALSEGGKVEEAAHLLQESMKAARKAGDARVLAHLTLSSIALNWEEEEGWAERVEGEAIRAAEVFDSHGDESGLSEAWRMLGFVAWYRGQIEAAELAWRRAILHADLAGDSAKSALDRAWLMTALLFGPKPVQEALKIARDAFEVERDTPVAQTQILWTVSVLQAMRGDFEDARDSFRRSAEIERTLGRELYSNHFATQVAATIENLAGAFDEQARLLREGLDRWESVFGEVNPILASMLAQALIELGEVSAAQSYVDAARGSAGSTHPHIEPLWQGAQARIFAQQGRFDEAEQVARDAVETLRPMEFTMQVADAHLTLAKVLHSRGSQEEASEEIGEALARYQSKGITPCIERATQLQERWNG